MQKLLTLFFIVALHLFCGDTHAQVPKDSIAADSKKVVDSAVKKPVKIFDPRVATRRSAMLAGWGQIYNRKYWKLPLVYGALGITVGVFFNNINTYKLLKQAYIYKIDTIASNDVLIDPSLQGYSATAIRTNRDIFRQNIDYSVLFFIVFWGLNIVDATVDAHLKGFDVNDNLSLRIKPGRSQFANTTGISLVFDIHSKKWRPGK